MTILVAEGTAVDGLCLGFGFFNLVPILFYALRFDDGTREHFGKCVHDTKLEGEIDAFAAIQRDLNRLEKWASRNLMKGKCKDLQWEGTVSCANTDWSWLARKQCCRKGPMTSGGQSVLEPAISPCCKESQMYFQLYVTRTREVILPLHSALLRLYISSAEFNSGLPKTRP